MLVDRDSGLTRATRSAVAAAVLLLLVGGAVGLVTIDGSPGGKAGADELASPGGPDVGAIPSVPETTAPPPTSAPAAPQGKAGGGDKRATTTTTAPAAPANSASRPGYEYIVTLTPTCAVVGQDFTVTFIVEPGSAVGVTAAYADGQMETVTRWVGNGDANGRAVHTWKAPPAPGWGRLLTGAMTPDGRTGGKTLDFEIVEPGGTCSEG